MLQFAAAVFFLIVTPGPGVLTTAGIGSGYGFRAGLSFLGGLFIGTNLVALAVVSGLAAALMTVPVLYTALFWASVGYLLYLAAKIALAGSRIAFIRPVKAPGLPNGVLLQLLNPKAYAVNTALFSGFGFLPDSPGWEVALKFMIVNTVWIPVHLAWLAAGVTLRRLDLPPRVQSAINIAMAVSMLAVVALAALAPR